MNKIVGILCIVNLGKCLINDNNKTMSRNNGIFLEFSPKYETIFCSFTIFIIRMAIKYP